MIFFRLIALLVACVATPHPALAESTASSASPKLLIQQILTPAIAEDAHFGILTGAFAVSPNGVSVVGTENGLWLVGADGAKQTANTIGITSFAFTPEGLLIGVRGRDLVYLDPRRGAQTMFSLPGEGMTLAPGTKDSLLLFGRDGDKGYALYVVHPGHRVAKIIHTPDPITSAAQEGKHYLLISGGALYGVTKHALKLLAGEPKGQLLSLAVDTAKRQIFLSDAQHIFRLDEKAVTPVALDMGGALRWQSGGLMVFDASRRCLVRLVEHPFEGK